MPTFGRVGSYIAFDFSVYHHSIFKVKMVVGRLRLLIPREVVAMGTGHHCKPHHSQGLPCEVLLWQLAVPEAAFLLPSALQSVPHRAAVLPPRLPDGGPAAQWAAVWCPQDCQWEANPSKFFKLHPSCCGHLCVLPPQLPPGGRISASFMCLQPPLVIFTAGYGGQRATHMPLRHCQFSAPSLI